MDKEINIIKELKDRILAIETRQEKLNKRCQELFPILEKYKDVDENE